MNKSSIVSFGCGPGPEIAAYISYVRNDLNCKQLYLNIVGVDILEGWKPFVDAVSRIDDHATVNFKAGELSNRYLRNLDHCDVCIMSYPHAMNFEDIWDNLKKKFTVIIFIDQPKPFLLNKANSNGFQFVNFYFNGFKKFFYYIDQIYYEQECLKEELKVIRYECRRNIHYISNEFDTCYEKIDLNLNCGHSRKILCYQSDELFECKEILKKKCQRNIHELKTPCGSRFDKCKELINLSLKCGHSYRLNCCENEKEISCKEFLSVTCPRNLHDIIISCGMLYKCYCRIDIVQKCGHVEKIFCWENEKELQQRMTCKNVINKCKRNEHKSLVICGSKEICEEIIKVKLKCGHKRDIICGDESLVPNPCMRIIMKVCGRGLHRHMLPCSSTIRCEDNIKYKLVCGHEHVMKCYEEIPLLVTTSEYCNVKNDGQMAEIEFDIISERGSNDDDEESLYLGSVDNNDDSKKCKERCDKVLNCGHRCQWSCHTCLNGRLHNRCLDTCPRFLKCGHHCADKCHVGKCKNCSKNCNSYPIRLVSIEDMSKWLELLLPRLHNLPDKIGISLRKILERVLCKKLTAKRHRHLIRSFEGLEKLLYLYDSLNSTSFADWSGIYIDDIYRSIYSMVNWICMDEYNSAQTSHKDINLEFQRINLISNICLDTNSCITDLNKNTKRSIFRILNKLMLNKYPEERLQDLSRRIIL